MAGGILVKVNLNEFGWQDAEDRKTCLSEIEEIASNAKGFERVLKGWNLGGTFHFGAEFTTHRKAVDFGEYLLIDTEYTGEVTYGHAHPKHRVVREKLPQK